MALGPKIIMGSLPGSSLNRCRECLVPAVFEPALDFRIHARSVALQHIHAWYRPCFLWQHGHNAVVAPEP
jgi:hypothetical protein